MDNADECSAHRPLVRERTLVGAPAGPVVHPSALGTLAIGAAGGSPAGSHLLKGVYPAGGALPRTQTTHCSLIPSLVPTLHNDPATPPA